MPIKIYHDKIEFIGGSDNVKYTLEETVNGFNFRGGFTANNIFTFQGTVAGYTAGGFDPGGLSNVIDKFPFAVDANATDVGNLTQARSGPSGQSSTDSGYSSGGAPTDSNVIDKFPFATSANATDVGDLTQPGKRSAGQSSSTHGYISGRELQPPPPSATVASNVIDRFPFASNVNATDVGDLSQARYAVAGQSSAVSGYISGGEVPPPGSAGVNTIDKFPFASNASATDVGDLTQARKAMAGQSSTVSGYTSGGTNTIDKFSFSTDASATDVGDLTITKNDRTGTSSTESGYIAGGGPPVSNVIEKFPFTTNANAADVGDLTTGRYGGAAGQQD